MYSGFWGGITLGRLVLPRLIQARFGDRKSLYGYITLSILLEFTVWFWKELVGNAVAICLIGFLMATFFVSTASISDSVGVKELIWSICIRASALLRF